MRTRGEIEAAASDGISTFAVCSKNGRETSLSSTGNVYC